jgi:S-DNA-T family DNA segregation ATPase FtsK/SpoIIIE
VRKEIRGLIFLLVAALLAGSLLSYHPADRVIWNFTGSLGKAQNLFGTAGAHIAAGLFFLLGFSSLWLVIAGLVLSLYCFRGRPMPSPIADAAALVFLLVSFSGILSLQLPEMIPYRGDKILAGGIVGLHLACVARDLLNPFGAGLLLTGGFIVSLLFLTSLSLARVFSAVMGSILAIAGGLADTVTKWRERRRRAQKTLVNRERLKSRPKVKIVRPPEPRKTPEQESFPFMQTFGDFTLPPLDLLNDPPEKKDAQVKQESLEMNARRLEKKLLDFGVEGEVVEILPGPVITMYEYRPAPGVKISKVAGLSDDLALALRAPSIRIVAPLPGKAAIGIEIPNNQREMVYLKEILSSSEFKEAAEKLPIALGKDITGAPFIADLAKMPHLLVAGATGSGKSVSINTMIHSLLFKVPPDMVRFLMIDPKRIELALYHDIPNLLHPVVTEPKDATRALRWAVQEMERRYMLLSDRGFRNLDAYNRKILKDQKAGGGRSADQGQDRPLPYIILIIDELADLMMTSSREVEEAITRLAQMARAAGIHLIIATQRPSVDVLTGIIKANFPARIAFQVSSKVDSRTILDTIGAEHLLGAGDMLFLPPGAGRISRIHGAFVSEEEMQRVTDYLRNQRKPEYDATILSEMAREETAEDEDLEMDEKYDEAVQIVTKTGQASISMLQRRLRVGYNRAARMIELMEREGVVGPSDGVRPREVYGQRPE